MRNGGLVENLPADACVEVACLADADGVRPMRYGSLPAACAALNDVQIAVQRLTVQAATTATATWCTRPRTRSPDATGSPPTIHEMVDRMLEAEAPWIPSSGLGERASRHKGHGGGRGGPAPKHASGSGAAVRVLDLNIDATKPSRSVADAVSSFGANASSPGAPVPTTGTFGCQASGTLELNEWQSRAGERASSP